MEPTVRPAKGTRTSLDSEGCVSLCDSRTEYFKEMEAKNPKIANLMSKTWCHGHMLITSDVPILAQW